MIGEYDLVSMDKEEYFGWFNGVATSGGREDFEDVMRDFEIIYCVASDDKFHIPKEFFR